MAEPYLLPENVSASHAAQVLEFLNAATSAEEIAVAVELPRELDVGLRVATRILARRDALGAFTSLEQIYAVPYVGPERFTELVTSLSGARPPQCFEGEVDRAVLTQITQRLNKLEAQLQPAPAIKLSVLNPDAWLGQESVLLAEVKDGVGKPLLDRAVTFVTTWGRLRGRAGLQMVAGNSVTVRTNHLGVCKLQLAPALGEALTAVEEASLSAALTVLGPAGRSPRDSLAALTELASRYRAPGNDPLRRAVDVYYRHYGSPDNADAPVDSLATWPRIAVTVLAYLTPHPDEATSHPTTSLLNLQQRNWFYAWIWAYRRLLERDSSLLASLGDVHADERTSGGMLTDLFGRVGSFMRAQDGWVGQLVGQEFAEASLNDFVQADLGKVAEQERMALLTGVTAGARALAGGSKVFSALETSRAGLSTKIDAGLADVDASAELGHIEGRLAELETNAVLQPDLASLQQEILTQAARNTSDQVAQLETQVNATLATKADASEVAGLSQQVAQLQDRDVVLQDGIASLDARLDTKADATRVETLNRQVLELQTQNRTLTNRVTAVNDRLNGVDTSIANLDTRLRGGPR